MIIVADNLQITNPAIETAIEQRDPAPIRELVKDCVSAGAQALDLNPGPLTRDPEDKMAFLVETVQAETDLPLLLDTTNARALSAGLAAARNPVIINGFSLEPVRLETILPLAAAFDADIIGYLLHSDNRVPIDEADCLQVATRVGEEIQKAGLHPEQLIVDPVIAPLIWEDGVRHNRAVLSVLRHLPDLLGFPVRTIAGLSNLTAGSKPYRKRVQMETTYLPMLAAAGLSMALLNVSHTETLGCAERCEFFLTADIFSWAALP